MDNPEMSQSQLAVIVWQTETLSSHAFHFI